MNDEFLCELDNLEKLPYTPDPTLKVIDNLPFMHYSYHLNVISDRVTSTITIFINNFKRFL